MFPHHDGKKYGAIVTGANGISGHHIVRVLSQTRGRWNNVFALSRRAPHNTQVTSRVVMHIAVDFLTSGPEEIAKILQVNNVHA